MEAVVILEYNDFVHVSVTEVAEGVIEPFTVGGSVHKGSIPVPVDFKVSVVKSGCLVIYVTQSAI